MFSCNIVHWCVLCVCVYVCVYVAEESEQNFSEDDGWEFVTLADQVSSCDWKFELG